MPINEPIKDAFEQAPAGIDILAYPETNRDNVRVYADQIRNRLSGDAQAEAFYMLQEVASDSSSHTNGGWLRLGAFIAQHLATISPYQQPIESNPLLIKPERISDYFESRYLSPDQSITHISSVNSQALRITQLAEDKAVQWKLEREGTLIRVSQQDEQGKDIFLFTISKDKIALSEKDSDIVISFLTEQGIFDPAAALKSQLKNLIVEVVGPENLGDHQQAFDYMSDPQNPLKNLQPKDLDATKFQEWTVYLKGRPEPVLWEIVFDSKEIQFFERGNGKILFKISRSTIQDPDLQQNNPAIASALYRTLTGYNVDSFISQDTAGEIRQKVRSAYTAAKS